MEPYESDNKAKFPTDEELQNAGVLSEEKIRELYGLSPDSPIVKQTVEFTSTYTYKNEEN